MRGHQARSYPRPPSLLFRTKLCCSLTQVRLHRDARQLEVSCGLVAGKPAAERSGGFAVRGGTNLDNVKIWAQIEILGLNLRTMDRNNLFRLFVVVVKHIKPNVPKSC